MQGLFLCLLAPKVFVNLRAVTVTYLPVKR